MTTAEKTTTSRPTNAILRGHVSRTAWSLAWPSAIAMLLQTLSNNIDRLLVGQLGPVSIAALGLGHNVLMLLFGGVMAISAATTALVARFTGAGNPDDAVEATRQSLYLAAILSVAVSALILPFVQPLLRLMAGNAVEIVGPAERYLMVSLVGILPLFGMTISIAAFRGQGDMLTPVKLTLSQAVLAAALDWVLIFGHFGFPKMGLQGAAWAGVISRLIVLFVALAVMWRSALGGAIRHFGAVQMAWLGRLLSLGLPAGLQNVLRTGASIVYFSFLGQLENGQAAMAALTIGLGIEAIAFMPGLAFSAAAAAMVGQNLGARSTARAAAAGWACARQSVLVMTAMAAVFYIWAPTIARWFTQDPEVIALTVAYLRINALSEPFIALSMTLSGALQGAGDTRSPTMVTFFVLWVVRLPLTYWLAVTLSLGAVAAWWTMAISMMAAGIGISLVFYSGRWKEIQI